MSIINPIGTDCRTENGSLTADASGGTGSYTYLWEPSGATSASPNILASFTHTVVVTDEYGCTDSSNETLLPPGGLYPNFTSITSLSCNGSNDGAITVSISGGSAPYSYEWSTGDTDAGVNPGEISISNLSEGVIAITITDASQCDFSIESIIMSPELLTVSTSSSSISCFGDETGEVSAFVSGGTTPYTYLWDDTSESTGSSANNLTGGVYTITVTDDNGCIATASSFIDPLTQIIASLYHDSITCYEACDGVLYASASGGTGSYSYGWFSTNPDAVTTPSIYKNICGNNENDSAYWVVVEDENGCKTDRLYEFVVRPDSIRAHIEIDGDQIGSSPFNVTFIDSSYGDYYTNISWEIEGDGASYYDDSLEYTFEANNEAYFNVVLRISRYGYCEDEDQVTIYLNSNCYDGGNGVVCPGIEENAFENLHVSTLNGSIVINGVDNGNVEIYSLVGNKVYQGAVANTTTININRNGMYLVKIISAGSTITKKVYLAGN